MHADEASRTTSQWPIGVLHPLPYLILCRTDDIDGTYMYVLLSDVSVVC